MAEQTASLTSLPQVPGDAANPVFAVERGERGKGSDFFGRGEGGGGEEGGGQVDGGGGGGGGGGLEAAKRELRNAQVPDIDGLQPKKLEKRRHQVMTLT